MRKFFLLVLLVLSHGLHANQKESTQIIVCENGIEMLDWDLEFISHAEHSIEALVCFFGGATAQTLLKAFEERLTEVPDLHVYVLASPTMVAPEDWKLIYHLQRCFPQHFHIEWSTQVVKLFPDIMTIDNHAKLFIVDETYFSIGGTNFEEAHCADGTFTPARQKRKDVEADYILPLGMRDQDVVGKGPIAADLRKAFFQLFALWKDYNMTKRLREDPNQFCRSSSYFDIVGERPFIERFENAANRRFLSGKQIRFFLGGPHQAANAITQEYVRLINNAQEEIILSHFYLFPPDPVFSALLDAANRGVKLTIMTNGLDGTCEGAKLFAWANRMSYVPLFYGAIYHLWDAKIIHTLPVKNTHIYEYGVPNVILHKKTMLVDNRFFVVGSYNLGMKSAYGDYEVILSIDSPEVAADVLQNHRIDLKYSNRISPAQACRWYFDPLIAYWGELQKRFGGLL